MHTSPEVLALLALGEDAGSPLERAHVHNCPVCSEEVAELARIADVGRMSIMSESLTAPGPQVWERIRTELGFDLPGDLLTRPEVDAPAVAARAATVTDLRERRTGLTEAGDGRRGTRGRRFIALAAAAALALVVGVGAGITYERQVVQPQNRVIARANLEALPQFPGATGTVEVTADGRGNRKLVLQMTSPEPIQGQAEVWLMASSTDASPAQMGIMSNGKAELDIPVGMSLFEKPLVDISEEPAGDTNKVHDGASILRGQLI